MLRVGLFFLTSFGITIDSSQAAVDFNRDIRPILSANCFACHGPDKESREGNLRLDTAKGARKMLGPVEDSELIYRIETDDEDDLMPPEDTGHILTEAQKKLLRAWVASGGA
jgi:mono/diheme cytochrome c family protein